MYNMKQTSKLFSIFIVMVIGVGLVPGVSSEKIFCSDSINLEEFPICKYQSEWNMSEKFNEKLIEALGERQAEINKKVIKESGEDKQQEINDLDRYHKVYSEVYREVYNTVDQENPGLKEQGEKLKEWIYKQLEE